MIIVGTVLTVSGCMYVSEIRAYGGVRKGGWGVGGGGARANHAHYVLNFIFLDSSSFEKSELSGKKDTHTISKMEWDEVGVRLN